MKKSLWLALLLMLICILSLSACDDANNQQSSTDTPNNGETIETETHIHAFGKWETAKDATCTENGEQKRTCECGEIEKQITDALGHTEVIDKAVAATCTATGLTEGKHCSVCNTVTVAQTTIKAKGHTEVIDKAVAATCTKTGKTEGKHCSVCNTILVKQTTIKALGHTEVIDQAVAATCTKTGLTEGKHCSVCDTVIVAQTQTPIAHDYADATCSEPMKCKVCGSTYGFHNGHSFSGNYCISCGMSLNELFNISYSTSAKGKGDRNYGYASVAITSCSKQYYSYNNSVTLTVKATGKMLHTTGSGRSDVVSYTIALYKDGVLYASKSCHVQGKTGESDSETVYFYNVEPGTYTIKIQ